jgi:hypothetical protein
MVIQAKKIVGPGRSLIQGPIAGRDVAFFKGTLLSVRFEAVVGPDVKASFFPRENLTPSTR